MGPRRSPAGFTLLEVLVALTIVSLAVVSLIELSAQGMRLLKLSSDHQRAVELADRIARDTEVSEEAVDSGEEGYFEWERRIALVPMPEELEPARALPGREAPGLFSVSVAVRWGRGHTVEVATLRAPTPPPGPEAQTPPAGEPAAGTPAAGTPGASTSGAGAPAPASGAPGAPRPSPPRPSGRGGSR